MKITGAQAIIECLLEQEVDTVFGYPGGAILPLYDALYDASIRHILPVHEQGAAHMADGYARASGKVGVCISTSGPGATNLVTGLATAFMDSIPVVAITGQVNTSLIGRDAFQEVDITGISLPITKHNFLVKDIQKLPDTIRYAFHIARTGRPGPVLIDIPRDLQTGMLDFQPRQPVEAESEWQPMPKAAALIDQAIAAISKAERPVMHIGGGVISANVSHEVLELAEKCKIPVVSSLMGLGGVSGAHPLFLGMTGLHGHKPANAAVHNADVIIAVGSRFNDRVAGDRSKYSNQKTLIHIDIDPAEIDKNVVAHIGLTGPIKNILTMINEAVTPRDISDWLTTIKQWQDEYRQERSVENLGLTERIMASISRRTAGMQTVCTTDVGQHQMWAAQHLIVENPRGWITSGGLGTMGFGLPSAIGAQFACPDKHVIHFAGDGGFKMTGSELFTVSTYKLPVISVVFDNSCLGMVRQLQYAFYPDRYSQVFIPSMDFVTYAKSFGIEGEFVDTQEGFEAAFDRALAERRPYVIAVKIDVNDLVIPMIAPGASLDQYIKLD